MLLLQLSTHLRRIDIDAPSPLPLFRTLPPGHLSRHSLVLLDYLLKKKKMALHHAEGGFGVTFNDVTKDAAFYTTTSRFVAWLGAFPQERQNLWL